MDLVVIALVAAAASLITFFSGFGLGTILLPVFIVFFPVDLAVMMTAVIHLFNGIFKAGLIGARASLWTVLHFGLPAAFCAFAGARLLLYLSAFTTEIPFNAFGKDLATTPVKLTIGLLLIFFALFEITPIRPGERLKFGWLWAGGALSGFFGGLSGHQGALRSAFLIRMGLGRDAFIATGIIISLGIDLVRLPVYITGMDASQGFQWVPVVVATGAAFAGALAGRRLLHKMTMLWIQYIVAVTICAIGIMLCLGLI